MIIDKITLRSKVNDKIANESFNYITGNVFINALPMDEQVTKRYIRPLFESFTNFTSGCGGARKMISTGMENTKNNKIANAFVNVVNDVVSASANEAMDRVTSSDLMDEPTIQSAVDKASMSTDEMNRLRDRAEAMSTDELAKCIKKKTIDVIREEREMYEKEDELKNDLQEALDGNESFKGITVEDYGHSMNRYETGHFTVFSKMMEMAFENLIYKYPYTDKELFNTITNVANECGNAFVKDFSAEARNFNAALEEVISYKNAANEEVMMSDEDKTTCMDDAMTAAMVVYSMIDTLNKLNFIKIDREKLEYFIKSKSKMDPSKCAKGDVDTVKAAVKTLTGDCTKELNKKVTKSVALERIDKLNQAKESLSITDELGLPSRPNPNFVEEYEAINATIRAYEALVDKDELMEDRKDLSGEILAYLDDQRDKTQAANVLKCNRIDKLFATLPQISDILFRIDPNQNFNKGIVVEAVGRSIDLTGTGSHYRTMREDGKHTMILNPISGVDPVDVLRAAVEASTINNDKYSVGIQVNDGYGRIMPI